MRWQNETSFRGVLLCPDNTRKGYLPEPSRANAPKTLFLQEDLILSFEVTELCLG